MFVPIFIIMLCLILHIVGVCYYRNISSFLVSILYVLKVDDDMATGKKKVRLRGTVAVNLRPDTKIEVIKM